MLFTFHKGLGCSPPPCQVNDSGSAPHYYHLKVKLVTRSHHIGGSGVTPWRRAEYCGGTEGRGGMDVNRARGWWEAVRGS